MGAKAKSINPMSCSDKVQRCSTTCELGRINALIKSGQFASMLHGEGEKVEKGTVWGQTLSGHFLDTFWTLSGDNATSSPSRMNKESANARRVT
jgi:hypothetical protein